MNTDPFVFGNRFLYSNCQQITKNGRTQMSFLQIGSMILFGSCIRDEGFALDTLFVVGGCQGYDPKTAVRKLNVPGIVRDTVLRPLSSSASCAINSDNRLRLYEGVTFESRDKFGNMFSFVPCRTLNRESGFDRPIIRPEGALLKFINPSLLRHRKQMSISDVTQMKPLWDEVVRQVLNANMLLGVRLDEPVMRAGASHQVGEQGSCSSC